jgi:type I restriction-modification system DNA methylase subunit
MMVNLGQISKMKDSQKYHGVTECNLPSCISISSDLSTIQTIKLAFEYIQTNSLECDFHELFFSVCKEKNLNVLNGAVQTPSYVAAFMVREAVKHLTDHSIETKWFDPCCGSGIFPEEIIRYAIQSVDIKSVSMLPRIHAVDVSAYGVFCTIINIHKIIEPLGITISEYMGSGRLSVEVKDTLSFFEEKTLFSEELYDVVIGNPPYIRSLRIDKQTKERLKVTFPETYSGTADLYYYFISGGINALNHDGLLCYISPANFFRLKSAAGLRSYLHQHAALLKLIDLDETKVFDDAEVHSAIYCMRKGREDLNNVFAYSHLRHTSELMKLSNHSVNYQDMSITGIKPDFWSFSEQKHNALSVNKNHLVSLKESGIQIYSGIRPSLKKAFVWKREDLSSLSNDEIKKWFRPCVTAQELKQWSPENKNLHLLFISDEENSLPDNILALLKPFEKELVVRAGTEARSQWYKQRKSPQMLGF